MAVVTARFYVGTDPVKALVDLNTKMMSAMDLAPPAVVLPPLIKPKFIDDVPILTLTLRGKNYDWYELRRLAASIENEIKKIQNTLGEKLFKQPRLPEETIPNSITLKVSK